LSPDVIQELRYTKQRLQRTIEELQTSNEELKSANEEMQSANEELQSTNEELETSKEELQSLNEELVTVNAEFQGKIDELADLNDDLHNLLNSTEVATIFLDNDLNIKRFTPAAKRVIHLIETDVGRPLTDIASKLIDDQLIEKAREVLQTLVFQEREVQATDGEWYVLRIFPYRTARNTIDGLVVTFLKVTAAKKAELAAREGQNFAESIIQTVRQPLIVLDGQFRVVTANQAFYQTFHLSPAEVEQQHFYQVGQGEWDIPALRRLLEEILPQNSTFQDFLVEHDFTRIGRRSFMVNGRRLEQEIRYSPAHSTCHGECHSGKAESGFPINNVGHDFLFPSSPPVVSGDPSGEEVRGEASGATMGRQTFRMDERTQMSEVTHDPGHPEYNEGSG
jgi:two-component system, chemotaxis family, CheB/CheR fusion protein